MFKQILLLAALVIFIGCSSDNTAGGAEDVNTFTVAGTVHLPDGSSAEGCAVVLFPVNYVPDGTEADSGIITGKDGLYSLVGDKEVTYNLWAIKDSLSFIVMNLKSDSGDIDRVDTLKEVGSVKVTLPDNFSDNSKNALYICGTGIFKELDDEDLIMDNGIVSVVVDGIAPQSYDQIIYEGDVTGESVLNDGVLTIKPAENIDDAYYAEWDNIILYPELIGKTITALATDNNGNFYVGTDSAGLFLYKDSSWQKIDIQSISLIGIKDIEIEGDAIYLLVDEGIIKIVGNIGTNISSNNSVVNTLTPSDLTVLSTGELFVSFSNGIGVFKNNGWNLVTTASSENLGSVTSISSGKNDELFAVNNFGILEYTKNGNNGSWEYVFKDDMQAKKVVVADSFNVWITSNKGLLSFDGSVLSTYDSIGTVGVNVVSAGKDNTIWSFGSLKKEIHGIRNNRSVYTEINTPLLQNIDNITGIASLDEKNVLFACDDKGIIKLSYKKLR